MSDDVHHDPDVPRGVHVRASPRAARVPDQERAGSRGSGRSDGSRRRAAAALEASTAVGGDRIASGAVTAAKQYSGITIGRINEAGPQALDDKNFSGPLWEKLTGIKNTVTEAPFAQIRTKILAEHVAKSGALDSIEMSPAWLPDFADQGVIIPIDSLIRKHRAASTLSTCIPVPRARALQGQDVGLLRRRRRLGALLPQGHLQQREAQGGLQGEVQADFRVPRGWDEFNQVAQFITDQMAPQVYGTGMGRALGNPGNQFYFFQQFRANGGRFFNRRR